MPAAAGYRSRQRRLSVALKRPRAHHAARRMQYSVRKLSPAAAPASPGVAQPATPVQYTSATAAAAPANECPHCHNDALLVDGHRSRCEACGYAEHRQTLTRANMSYGEKLGVAPSNYRRYIHFRDVVKRRVLSQPVDRTDPKYATAKASVTRALIKQGVRQSIDVTLRLVQRVCRDLHIKGPNTAIAITEDLSGVPSPTFTPFDYNRLYCMFQAMQGPFDLHKPRNRTNFLHYNHIAFRLIFLLGWDQYLYTYFWPMLGNSKIAEFDELFTRMCSDPSLNWQVSRTYKLAEARNLALIHKRASLAADSSAPDAKPKCRR